MTHVLFSKHMKMTHDKILIINFNFRYIIRKKITTLLLVSFYFVFKITKDYNFYKEILNFFFFFYTSIVGESKS